MVRHASTLMKVRTVPHSEGPFSAYNEAVRKQKNAISRILDVVQWLDGFLAVRSIGRGNPGVMSACDDSHARAYGGEPRARSRANLSTWEVDLPRNPNRWNAKAYLQSHIHISYVLRSHLNLSMNEILNPGRHQK